MASLLSGLGSTATGIGTGIGSIASSVGSGIGAAAKAGNNMLSTDIGGTTAPDVLPAGVQGPVRPGVGTSGVNWGDILNAAQSGGNTKGMMPLVNKQILAQNNANKRTDLQEAVMVASALFGGGI